MLQLILMNPSELMSLYVNSHTATAKSTGVDRTLQLYDAVQVSVVSLLKRSIYLKMCY